MNVSLVWAQSTSGVLGRAGGIPWDVPEDLTHFKNLTMSHTVVMGRRTWESLPLGVRPLPGRRNVVLTRQTDFAAEGASVVHTFDEALTAPDIWVVGGEQVYTLAMPLANRCEITEVDIDLPRDDGDVVAPTLDESWLGVAGGWRISRSGLRYRMHSYRRV
jgi:dihydrofolate reductase